MNLNRAVEHVTKTVRDHSPAILTALGVTGVVSTAYLTGRASYQAALVIDHDERVGGTADDPRKRLKERTKLVWKLYIPPALAGTATIACIIAATKVGTRRTAAMTAAYSLTERAFSEYRDKVAEKFGDNKEKAIRDEIAQEALVKNPPPSKEVLITGPGNVLCCELMTKRYFTCNMETLRRAENEVNAKVLHHINATLDDFYHMIGLESTSYSSELGWDSDRLMGLEFSTLLTEDGRPCLAFDYNYTKAV